MKLKNGHKIDGGRYEIVQELERQGCMSKIYFIKNNSGVNQLLKINLGRDEIDKEAVSQNVYIVTGESPAARTKREFQIASKIYHHNVAEYLELVKVGGKKRGIITGRFDKKATTLDQMIKKKVDDEKRLDAYYFLMPQMIDVLAEFRKKGIRHRDIKPENIIVDDNMHLQVLDFGVAELNGNGNYNRRGSSFYCPPEVLNNGPDKYYDYWSTGIVLLEFLLGRHPFISDKNSPSQRTRHMEMMMAVDKDEIKDITDDLLEHFYKIKNTRPDIRENEKEKRLDLIKLLINYKEENKSKIDRYISRVGNIPIQLKEVFFENA